MSPRDWRLSVQDMLDAISKIEQYVRGMSLADFQADSKTVDAVAMNVTINGEAANNVPDEARALCPSVPWRKMRDIRSVLVHGYFGLRVAILWETAVADLPPLVPMLSEMLRLGDRPATD